MLKVVLQSREQVVRHRHGEVEVLELLPEDSFDLHSLRGLIARVHQHSAVIRRRRFVSLSVRVKLQR